MFSVKNLFLVLCIVGGYSLAMQPTTPQPTQTQETPLTLAAAQELAVALQIPQAQQWYDAWEKYRAKHNKKIPNTVERFGSWVLQQLPTEHLIALEQQKTVSYTPPKSAITPVSVAAYIEEQVAAGIAAGAFMQGSADETSLRTNIQQTIHTAFPGVTQLTRYQLAQLFQTPLQIEEITTNVLHGQQIHQIPVFHQLTVDFSLHHGSSTCGPMALHNVALLVEQLQTGISMQDLLKDATIAKIHAQMISAGLENAAATIRDLIGDPLYRAGASVRNGIVNDVEYEILQRVLADPTYTMLPRSHEIGYAIVNAGELLRDPLLGKSHYHMTYAPHDSLTAIRTALLGHQQRYYATIVIRFMGHYWAIVIAKNNQQYTTYIVDSMNIDRMILDSDRTIIQRLLEIFGVLQ
ncbi:hypothetical protein M1466_02260 [Candidatus Dependentiae bacterium]|nr:hypothetical protein [Candidatus Dependentiae bacterium]